MEIVNATVQSVKVEGDEAALMTRLSNGTEALVLASAKDVPGIKVGENLKFEGRPTAGMGNPPFDCYRVERVIKRTP